MSSGPAKLVSEMTPEERRQSLQEWAEEQKYVRPGEGGTLSFGMGGVRDMRTQSYSGPVRLVPPQYDAPIAPPSYDTAMESSVKKAGPVRRWLEKRGKKKRSKSVG